MPEDQLTALQKKIIEAVETCFDVIPNDKQEYKEIGLIGLYELLKNENKPAIAEAAGKIPGADVVNIGSDVVVVRIPITYFSSTKPE